MWVFLLLWLAVPVAYVVVLGGHYVRRCRAELDRARSFVEDTYQEIEDLVVGRHARHRQPE